MTDETNPKEGNDPKTDPKSEKETFDLESVKKLVQSETDKVRTDLWIKIKEKDAEIEKLKTDQMTDKQKAQYEAERLSKELAKKETDLKAKELSLFAYDHMKKENIDPEFYAYIIGGSEDEIKTRAKSFMELFNKYLAAKVDEKLKGAGREPGKGRETSATSDIFNMTPDEILKKQREDPTWFEKNEKVIFDALAQGKFTKK